MHEAHSSAQLNSVFTSASELHRKQKYLDYATQYFLVPCMDSMEFVTFFSLWRSNINSVCPSVCLPSCLNLHGTRTSKPTTATTITTITASASTDDGEEWVKIPSSSSTKDCQGEMSLRLAAIIPRAEWALTEPANEPAKDSDFVPRILDGSWQTLARASLQLPYSGHSLGVAIAVI